MVSDTDMLCALEIHVPGIRAIHSGLSPLVRIVGDWEAEELERIDKRLNRNLRVEREKIQKAFADSSLSRLKALGLDECSFTQEVDLYTLLEMGWGMHMLERAAVDTYRQYEMVYQTLTSRIAGRNPMSQELDDLHKTYGQLTQARVKLGTKLGELTACFSSLASGYPMMQRACDAAVEAYSACTDVRDFLMLLKDAHHRGFEYARKPLA